MNVFGIQEKVFIKKGLIECMVEKEKEKEEGKRKEEIQKEEKDERLSSKKFVSDLAENLAPELAERFLTPEVAQRIINKKLAQQKEEEKKFKPQKKRNYDRGLFVLTFLLLIITATVYIGYPIFKSLYGTVVSEPDFVVELSGITVPFDDSILNEESFLYVLEPTLKVPKSFVKYYNLKCTFSYKNKGKESLRDPLLEIYLIDPIDRVVAYEKYKMSDLQKLTFTFKERSNIRYIEGSVRVLVTLKNDKMELVGYAIAESEKIPFYRILTNYTLYLIIFWLIVISFSVQYRLEQHFKLFKSQSNIMKSQMEIIEVMLSLTIEPLRKNMEKTMSRLEELIKEISSKKE